MKAFILAADAVIPEVIFSHRQRFPNLNRIIVSGASSAYSAYVQKGYNGSYSSEQNWASIYTGLEPKVHGIHTGRVNGIFRKPQMGDFRNLLPFWEILNKNGYSVGLWCADSCINPTEIDGYVVSVKYDMIETPVENRLAPRELSVNSKDAFVLQFLNGLPPPRLYPRTLKQQGHKYSDLLQCPDLAEKAVSDYHFQDALDYFEWELEYFFSGMIQTQREHSVDVMYFYTVTTDLIEHCSMCRDENEIVIAAYQLLDRYLGKIIDEFHPEIAVFLSDHGQQNFKDLIKCSDPETQREAFAARDEALWLKNGYIAFEAHNGALLFTAHSLKGTFIAAGEGIRHTTVNEMRTIDIYPTLLECFGVRIPDQRNGYVADIFNRALVNSDKLIRRADMKHESIALIQTHSVSVMDIIINELYIEQRFKDIAIVGEPKYEEIFLNNPRVAGFFPFGQFDPTEFNEVYCGFFNEATGIMSHIKIYGD